MKLPNLNLARIEREKITEYLLNPAHPEGGQKAAFFTRFGFEGADWQSFASALLRHAADHEIARESQDLHGTIYVVEGVLHCPDGRTPEVRTVWIVDRGSVAPRLVTAYPLR